VHLAQGAEMGRFLLGSTVVMLFPPGSPLQFGARWQPGAPIRMGEAMAQRVSGRSVPTSLAEPA
jgi:phosphatidylserine decarboxylase